MKQYTREELIAELAQNVNVMFASYGTWEIKSYIGQRATYRYCADHYIEVGEITHSEEDETGIMEGETYNPQDINEWFEDVFKRECSRDDEYLEAWYAEQEWGEFDEAPDISDNCVAQLYDKWCSSVTVGDPILKDLFDKYCEAVWSDSANEYNYEPRDDKNKRLAERLFDSLIEDDRIVLCGDGYLIMTEEEEEFLSNNRIYMSDIYNGKLDEFSAAFEKWEDDK